MVSAEWEVSLLIAHGECRMGNQSGDLPMVSAEWELSLVIANGECRMRSQSGDCQW